MSNSQFSSDSAVVSVEADLVKAALPFAAKHDVRYYLNGVCIMPAKEGGALIIATNGTVMVCIRDSEGVADKARIIPLQHGDARHLKSGHKLCLGADKRAWVHNITLQPTWICPELEIDGKLPDVFGLLAPIDKYSEGLVGAFDPRLIDLIRKGARGRYPAVRFFHRADATGNTGNTGAVFTFGPNGFGVLMPMRDEGMCIDLASSVPAEFQQAA